MHIQSQSEPNKFSNMVLSKWTSEMTIKFISLYREQECLWNTDSLAYRDKDTRAAAMKTMMDTMQLPKLTIDDVKKKIKYLRSTYMVEVNKVVKSERAGTGNIYRPSLVWFNAMDSFIKYNCQSKRNKQNTLNGQTENSTSDVSQGGSQSDLETEQFDEIGNIQGDWQQVEKIRKHSDYQTVYEQADSSKERRRDIFDNGIKTEWEQLGPSNSKRHRHQFSPIDRKSLHTSDITKKKVGNEFDVFGKYVGIQLNSLLEEDAVVAEEEIQSILTRYKLKKIRHQNKDHVSHSSHTSEMPQSQILQNDI